MRSSVSSTGSERARSGFFQFGICCGGLCALDKPPSLSPKTFISSGRFGMSPNPERRLSFLVDKTIQSLSFIYYYPRSYIDQTSTDQNLRIEQFNRYYIWRLTRPDILATEDELPLALPINRNDADAESVNTANGLEPSAMIGE